MALEEQGAAAAVPQVEEQFRFHIRFFVALTNSELVRISFCLSGNLFCTLRQ